MERGEHPSSVRQDGGGAGQRGDRAHRGDVHLLRHARRAHLRRLARLDAKRESTSFSRACLCKVFVFLFTWCFAPLSSPLSASVSVFLSFSVST